MPQVQIHKIMTYTSISIPGSAVFINISLPSGIIFLEPFHAVPQVFVLLEVVNCPLSINVHLSSHFTHQSLHVGHVSCVRSTRCISRNIHNVHMLRRATCSSFVHVIQWLCATSTLRNHLRHKTVHNKLLATKTNTYLQTNSRMKTKAGTLLRQKNYNYSHHNDTVTTMIVTTMTQSQQLNSHHNDTVNTMTVIAMTQSQQ